jgi:hypothetical protein
LLRFDGIGSEGGSRFCCATARAQLAQFLAQRLHFLPQFLDFTPQIVEILATSQHGERQKY